MNYVKLTIDGVTHNVLRQSGNPNDRANYKRWLNYAIALLTAAFPGKQVAVENATHAEYADWAGLKY